MISENDPELAERVADIEPFRVVEMLTRAGELQAAGVDVIHMEAGEPDFPTAPAIVAAAKRALDEGRTRYTPAAGIPELREALSAWYRSQHGLDIPASRIMVTPGGSGALLLLSALLVNPGKGILMADPGYPCNRHFLRLVEGQAQLVPVGPVERYQLTAEKLAEHWRDNTVGALVASPSNPTGTALDNTQMRELFEACNQRGGSLIADEIYQDLVFEGDVRSILAHTDRALVMNSFSKYFGMTGWRLGWLVAPQHLVQELEKLAQNLFISSSAPSQYAALAAFEPATQALLAARKKEFGTRRTYLLQALRSLGFKVDAQPVGAFYIYANIRGISQLDAREFCLRLLEEQGVAITPGADFGDHLASEHVRFAFTTSLPRIEEAVHRLGLFLGQ
ncbi:MAG: pyridoxal phosphate-dependent aminotransferase [Pseudomonadales bacterium]|nr:MAG: pyridoxal phosphate-dependent aminotransferase [Pseudomonadales bacterium]